jgi:thioredoxin-dependent peroxiredoxin
MKYLTIVTTALLLLMSNAFAFSSSSSPTNSATRFSTKLNVKVGEVAPDFALKDQNGKVVKRSGFKKPLVVYFYPADATPGCTTQAKEFNKAINNIRKQYGADVVGISGQDVASKQAFAKDLGLTFSILADEGDKVRTAFGVPKAAFGLLPGRVTYILDKNGVVQKVYDDLANAAKHIEVATITLASLK